MHTVKREAGWERTGGSISDSRRKAALRNGNSPGFQKCRSSHDAAAVLTKEEVVLEGCPKISDVEDMAEIVRSLGGTVWWERNALHLNCEKIEKSRVEGALSKRLRASLLFLGIFLQGQGRHTLQGPAAAGSESGRRTCIRGQWSFWEPRSSRRTAPFGQRQIIRKEPCSAFRKRVSGRRKCGSFCCRSGRCNKAGALCAGAGSGSSLPVS